MVSFRGQKERSTTRKSVSFRGLIQDFRRASPPPSYAETLPRGFTEESCEHKSHIARNFESTCAARGDTFHYREMTKKRSKIDQKTALKTFVFADTL